MTFVIAVKSLCCSCLFLKQCPILHDRLSYLFQHRTAFLASRVSPHSLQRLLNPILDSFDISLLNHKSDTFLERLVYLSSKNLFILSRPVLFANNFKLSLLLDRAKVVDFPSSFNSLSFLLSPFISYYCVSVSF